MTTGHETRYPGYFNKIKLHSRSCLYLIRLSINTRYEIFAAKSRTCALPDVLPVQFRQTSRLITYSKLAGSYLHTFDTSNDSLLHMIKHGSSLYPSSPGSTLSLGCLLQNKSV